MIHKIPIVGVMVLGVVALSYLWGWYVWLFGSRIAFGVITSNIFLYIILAFRFFITCIAVAGFYFAVKGMMAKEQFEKKYETLDEDEL